MLLHLASIISERVRLVVTLTGPHAYVLSLRLIGSCKSLRRPLANSSRQTSAGSNKGGIEIELGRGSIDSGVSDGASGRAGVGAGAGTGIGTAIGIGTTGCGISIGCGIGCGIGTTGCGTSIGIGIGIGPTGCGIGIGIGTTGCGLLA